MLLSVGGGGADASVGGSRPKLPETSVTLASPEIASWIPERSPSNPSMDFLYKANNTPIQTTPNIIIKTLGVK